MKKKEGFSLIELLVVIAIIGILATIGLNSYQNIMKTARDAKRKSDLKDIQMAYEQYYINCKNLYPSVTPGNSILCPDPSLMFLPTWPLDPKSTTPYLTSGTIDSSVYLICATPEVDNTICIQNKQ